MTMKHAASSLLPTEWAEFQIHGFEDTETGKEHVALTLGELGGIEPLLCRIHSECLTGDSFRSRRCDCGPQLDAALSLIASEGRGILLYLRQEGRGIGLINKLRAYQLQDQGADTVEANEQLGFEADMRTYDICETMLSYFSVNKIRLMTNNPKKIEALRLQKIEVTERVKLECGANSHNKKYLQTKASKLGHLLNR
ncbi:GTP cyclohydrolase II [Marinobacter sp.]|uniref:GTP cyclohydrolase II n=1 Tax=Marinobacter sp. TaxID=50741 RepID=UPI003BAB11CF